jgi:hypothetical protein
MAANQGFRGRPNLQYAYVEGASTSVAMGIDDTDSGLFKIQALTGSSALPTLGAQLTINPSANGDITLAPNGSGDTIVEVNNLQVSDGSLLLFNNDVSIDSSIAIFRKNRAGSIVQSGDGLGLVAFTGFDGAQYWTGAQISSNAIGTMGVNQISGNLGFWTNPSSTVPLLRMNIDQFGQILVNAPTSGTTLTLGGTYNQNVGGTQRVMVIDNTGKVGVNTAGIVATTYTTDSGNAVPAAGVLNVLSGPGMSTSGSGNTITLTNTGGGLDWSVETAASVQMVVNHGYIANRASAITFTLPVTAAVGSIIRITGINTALGWAVAQNAGQSIRIISVSTVVGVGGSLASTAVGDSIELVCVVADTTFNMISVMGNITIV